MAKRESLGEESPVLRFFKPYVRSYAIVATTLVFILLAGYGFFLARSSLVNLRFVELNPIQDREIAEKIAATPTPGDEFRQYLAKGSLTAAETLYLPPVVVLRVMSMGYQTALADILFVRAHAYFLSHFFVDRIFGWLDNYTTAITGLDPDNPKVYLWAAQVAKLGQIINDDTVERSNGFLSAGIERFPQDWRLHMDLAFNLYFEFAGNSDAEKAQARLKARDHFAIAAGLPGSQIDPNFVAELFDDGHEQRLAIAYALQKYYEANEEQRAQFLRRIGTISAALADGIAREERRWKEVYPYIPVALFTLVDDHSRQTAEMFQSSAEGKREKQLD